MGATDSGKGPFQSLKGSISEVYGKALDARSNKTHCLTLARFTGKLEPILREVELVSGAVGHEAAAAAISAVWDDVVHRALDLVLRAGGMGKCRAIIQADTIINEFQTITDRLADALATVGKFRLRVADDVVEDIDHLSSQLNRLKYRESKKVQELSIAVRRDVAKLSAGGNDSDGESLGPLQMSLHQVLVLAKLMDVNADSPNEHQIQALQLELEDVKKQRELAQKRGNAEDERLWRHVESALDRIVYGNKGKPKQSRVVLDEASVPEPPEEFLCPISLELMADPVIMVETAMTYDRSSIEQHFASGHSNCPLSGRSLVSKRMIPNYNLRSAVETWAKANNVDLTGMQLGNSKSSGAESPSAASAKGSSTNLAAAASATSLSLDELQGASSGVSGPNLAAANELPSDIKVLIQELDNNCAHDRAELIIKRICDLTDKNNGPRVDMRAAGGIPVLVKWLTEGSHRSRGMVAKALWYCAREDDNTMIIAMAGAIPLLVQLLWGGTDEGKESAARAFWNLSTYNQYNKVEIAKAGAIPALVHLLTFGKPAGKEAAAGALRSLAVNDDNEMEIVRSGAVPALLDVLMSGTDTGKEVSLGALHNLARTDWRSEVMNSGALDVLQQLSVSTKVRREVQKQAASLLKRLNGETSQPG